MITEPEVKWSTDQMIEITLNEPDDFLSLIHISEPTRQP